MNTWKEWKDKKSRLILISKKKIQIGNQRKFRTKNTVTNFLEKKSLDGLNSKMEMKEGRSVNLMVSKWKLSNLDNKVKTFKKINRVSRDVWDNIKYLTFSHQSSRRRKNSAEKIVEGIVSKNFPDLIKKNTNPQIKEVN